MHWALNGKKKPAIHLFCLWKLYTMCWHENDGFVLSLRPLSLTGTRTPGPESSRSLQKSIIWHSIKTGVSCAETVKLIPKYSMSVCVCVWKKHYLDSIQFMLFVLLTFTINMHQTQTERNAWKHTRMVYRQHPVTRLRSHWYHSRYAFSHIEVWRG